MAYSRTPWLAGLAAALLLVPAAPAADVDKLLPADTTVVVDINVKQILDSSLVKKLGLDAAREALKSADEVKQVLEDLGFDPFRDLDRITVASPGGTEQDRGLLIVRGRFDVDKFKAKAAETAKDQPDLLKIQKVPGGLVYKVAPPGQENPIFVAILNRGTLVASPGKDYVVDAMEREAGKSKAALKNKDFQAVLERIDGKQSLSFAAVGAAFKGADLGPAREFIESLEAVAGGLTLGDELKVEVVLSTRSEDDAKKMKEVANTGLNSAIALIGFSGGDKKELEKVVDFLKSVKVTAKDKTVTIKGRLDSDVFEGLIDKNTKDDK